MRVFATCPLPGDALERVARHCELDIWNEPHPVPPAVLAERLRPCEGLICLLVNRVDEDLLRQCHELRFVSSMAVGVDHIDVDALTRRGMTCTWARTLPVPPWASSAWVR